MKRLQASHHALRSDVDFVSGQKGRVRLDQSVIRCNWSLHRPWLLVPAVISSASSVSGSASTAVARAGPPELSYLGRQLIV